MNDVKVLLLAVNKWDFNDEKTGELRKGTTAHVIHFEDVPNENVIGQRPVKYSLPYEKYNEFVGKKLPAFAEMESTYDWGRGKMIPTNFNKLVPLEAGATLGQSRS